MIGGDHVASWREVAHVVVCFACDGSFTTCFGASLSVVPGYCCGALWFCALVLLSATLMFFSSSVRLVLWLLPLSGPIDAMMNSNKL